VAEEELHRRLMIAAIERDAAAQRALLADDTETARASFEAAAELYRQSWEVAPPRSYGRLIGMLKSAVLAGRGDQHTGYVTRAVPDQDVTSPPAAYTRALGALAAGDDTEAVRWAEGMRAGPGPFERTAEAIAALATRDQVAYERVLTAIVRDFEQRNDHLTGVAIADTALMLEELAARRGVRADVSSPLMPAR
jgi:hypothetical protein